MDAKASACALTCVVTDQFVWGAQARIISTQIASRFCWCSLPSDGQFAVPGIAEVTSPTGIARRPGWPTHPQASLDSALPNLKY